MACAHCEAAGELFDDKRTRKDLKRYRKKGPDGTTRMLLEAIRGRGVEGRTLLDIGGGIGVIQHDLLDAGVTSAVNVDASPEYQAAALEQTRERGRPDAIEFHLGDFVEIAPDLDRADIVTLDRVICCYPHMRVLVGASAAKARKLYGLVFPKEHVLMRFGIAVINLMQRLRRSDFRVFAHSTEEVEDELARRGFDRVYQDGSFLWQVRLYERTTAPA